MSTTRKVAVSETGRTTRTVMLAQDITLAPAKVIRRPRITRRPWRTEGEAFDPAKVTGAPSTTR